MQNIFRFFIVPALALLVLNGCSTTPTEMSQHDSKAGECEPINEIIKMGPSVNRLTIEDDGDEYGVVSWLVKKVSNVIKDASLKIYLKIAVNIDFRFLVAMMMTLAVVLFAASVLLGLIQANGYNALMFVLKLIVIYHLTINYFHFYTYVIQTFEALVTDTMMFSSLTFSDYLAVDPTIICLGLFGQACDIGQIVGTLFFGSSSAISDFVGGIFGGNVGDAMKKLYLFSAFDDTISYFFDVRMWKIVMALATTGMSGIFWAVMIALMQVLYLFAVIAAVKVYLLSYIARWTLYGLGPIFISFALFKQTKSLFDGWLQQLISFTLQPVLLFIFLGMFQSMISGFTTQLYVDIGESTGGYDMVIDCPVWDPIAGTFTSANAQDCIMISCDATDPQCYCNGNNCEKWIMRVAADGDSMCVKWTEFNREGGTAGQNLYWYKLCQTVGNGVGCINSAIKPVIPIDIWMVMAIIVMCYLMIAMCGWVTEVANSLASGAMSVGRVRIMGWDTLKQGVGSGFKGLLTSATRGGPGTGGGTPPAAGR